MRVFICVAVTMRVVLFIIVARVMRDVVSITSNTHTHTHGCPAVSHGMTHAYLRIRLTLKYIYMHDILYILNMHIVDLAKHPNIFLKYQNTQENMKLYFNLKKTI